MPNFLKLQTDLLNYAGEEVSDDPKIMAKSAINRFYMNILRSIKQDVVMREFSFTTVASTSQYGLSPYIQDVINIDDPSNVRQLINISADRFDRAYPGNTLTGSPNFFYQLKRQGVKSQPASAGVISVVSDSTSDATNFFLRVSGFDSNGILQTEKLTLNGTTTVTGTKSFSITQGGIERLAKSTTSSSYTWSGTLTVKDDDANTIAIIPPNIDSPTYLWLEFQTIPDDDYTYVIRAKSYRPMLMNDDDWPEIDEHYHDLLLYGPGSEMLIAFGKPDLAVNFDNMFKERFKDFKTRFSPRPKLVGQFADVTLGYSFPNRPLIRGVDVGLSVG